MDDIHIYTLAGSDPEHPERADRADIFGLEKSGKLGIDRKESEIEPDLVDHFDQIMSA